MKTFRFKTGSAVVEANVDDNQILVFAGFLESVESVPAYKIEHNAYSTESLINYSIMSGYLKPAGKLITHDQSFY